MRFEGTVVGDAQVIAKFDGIPNRVRGELRIGIGRSALMVQRQSKQSKLTGQVLNVRTGRLRRSINVKHAETATSVEATVGTNVEYAKPHEYGFKGVVTVREHLRRAVNGGVTTVRSHPRKVDLPERSFLRSALRDCTPVIQAELRAAVHRAIA